MVSSVTVCASVPMVEHFEGNLAVPSSPVTVAIAEIFSAVDGHGSSGPAVIGNRLDQHRSVMPPALSDVKTSL